MTIIRIWSGREIRALREAKRMSQREFAATLGVNERLVAKWEAGGEKMNPRPVNQAALDSSLAAESSDVHARFQELLNLPRSTGAEPDSGDDYSSGTPFSLVKHQVRHPIDGKLMVLVEAGEFIHGDSSEPISVPAFYIDVFPVTNADYTRFVAATDHRAPQHWNQGQPSDRLLNHPVVFVTWDDAAAYASWAAKSLPSREHVLAN